MMIGFGSMALFNAAAKNFGELFFIRIVLGVCESAMLPGVVFYLSTFCLFISFFLFFVLETKNVASK